MPVTQPQNLRTEAAWTLPAYRFVAEPYYTDQGTKTRWVVDFAPLFPDPLDIRRQLAAPELWSQIKRDHPISRRPR